MKLPTTRQLAFAAAIIVLLVVLRFALMSLSSPTPDNFGHRDGLLAPCPKSPNCVSSQARNKAQYVEPLAVAGPTDEALDKALRAIEKLPGARVVTFEGPYLRAEFTSRLFRFVDDLELLYDAEPEIFQVRSASRVGRSDLGANRKRVETLRRRLSSG